MKLSQIFKTFIEIWICFKRDKNAYIKWFILNEKLESLFLRNLIYAFLN